MNEVEQAWAIYKEALDRCVTATKLTAFHTQECAEATEKVVIQASIAVLKIREYIAEVKESTNMIKTIIIKVEVETDKPIPRSVIADCEWAVQDLLEARGYTRVVFVVEARDETN